METVNDVMATQLRKTLAREEAKIVRQRDSVDATEALIKMLKAQIADLEKAKK